MKKQSNELTENKLTVTKGEKQGKVRSLGSADKTTVYKTDKQGPANSTGNDTHHLTINYDRKELEKERTSHYAVHQKLALHINYIQ